MRSACVKRKGRQYVTEDEINAEIDQIKAVYPSTEIFEQAMAEYGLTYDRLVKEIRINLILQKLAAAGVTITDEEISAYFENNKAALGTPKQVRSSHILVDSLAEAEMVIAELKEGADFAVLAQQISGRGALYRAAISAYQSDVLIVPEYLTPCSTWRSERQRPVKSHSLSHHQGDGDQRG